MDHLIDQLKSYRRIFSEESPKVDLFIDFLLRNEKHASDPCLSEGHLTGSCWLTNRAGDAVLLTHHKKLGKWLQLGGHADGQTDLLQVALREGREESGIDSIEPVTDRIFDIDRHLIPARGDFPDHFHYDVRFACRTVMSEDFQISDESHELRWVPLTEISKLTQEESVLRMLRKWLWTGTITMP